MALWC